MTADEMLQAEARPEAEYERLQKIRDIAPELDYAAVFVPQSQSRNKDEKNPSLNWRVTLRKIVRSYGGYRDDCKPVPYEFAEILTCDYMQGVGHCPAYKASVKELGGRNCIMRDDAIRSECETGRESVRFKFDPKRLPPPDLADVLHSLLLDAEALDFGGFEEWAREMGYDPDSRDGERVYRACLETGLKLRAALGDEKMAKLREALQDM